MLEEVEWKIKKHGAEYRHQWRFKVHLGIDAESLEIRAIELTDNKAGYAPMLPELMNQTPVSEEIAAIYCDGATIPMNATMPFLLAERQPSFQCARMHSFGKKIRRERGKEMRCFKLLGERVRALDFDRQIASHAMHVAI